MAWRRAGAKPLSEPILVTLLNTILTLTIRWNITESISSKTPNRVEFDSTNDMLCAKFKMIWLQRSMLSNKIQWIQDSGGISYIATVRDFFTDPSAIVFPNLIVNELDIKVVKCHISNEGSVSAARYKMYSFLERYRSVLSDLYHIIETYSQLLIPYELIS